MKRGSATLLIGIALCAGCGRETPRATVNANRTSPPATGASTAAPPASLARLLDAFPAARLPDAPDGAAQLLAGLPADLAGAARTASSPREVSYRGGTLVSAAPLAEAARPGMSMRTFFDTFVASGQFTVTSRSATGAKRLWFLGTSTDSPTHAVAAIANADGHWLYGLEAADNSTLAALVDRLRAEIG